MPDLRAGRDRGVHQGDRRVRDARAVVTVELAGDDPEQRAAVLRGQQRDLAGPDVLVARRGHLEPRGQVDPELEAVEQAAAHDEFLGRRLDVQDAAAGGHPLGVAVGDQAAAAVGVLVPEHAVDDVRDGLEAAVRVPRGALGLARRVLDLAHLVHVDERVEVGQVHAGERAADREALALVARWRGGDLDDRAVPGRRGLGDSRQDQQVLDGYGRHDDAPQLGPGSLSYPATGQQLTSVKVHEGSTFLARMR
jgi:hypothetical protein